MKATKEQEKRAKAHRHRHLHGAAQREGGGAVTGKGTNYLAVEGDLTWGGGHTVQQTDQVSRKSTLRTSAIVLTTRRLNNFNLRSK